MSDRYLSRDRFYVEMGQTKGRFVLSLCTTVIIAMYAIFKINPIV